MTPKKIRLASSKGHSFKSLSVKAAQGESQQEQDFRQFDSRARMGRTRLATRVTTLPRRADLYFAGELTNARDGCLEETWMRSVSETIGSMSLLYSRMSMLMHENCIEDRAATNTGVMSIAHS